MGISFLDIEFFFDSVHTYTIFTVKGEANLYGTAKTKGPPRVPLLREQFYVLLALPVRIFHLPDLHV
jgi:hypothetical protein